MSNNELVSALEGLLPGWLPAHRWFSSGDQPPAVAKIIDQDVLRDAWPRLLWLLVQVDGDDTYQVPVGVRQAEQIGGVLLGHENALIGKVTIDGEDLVLYDALIDAVLNRVLFDVVMDGAESVRSVRPIGTEQSNTSLVFDNRFIIKFFRRLHEGPNPDLEVTLALTRAGFKHVAPVVGTWQRVRWDLAVCQPYLWDGTDGWKLALASVRDFLGSGVVGGSATAGSPAAPLAIDPADPSDAGGDFADEASRLGEMTAELHAGLASTFPVGDFDPASLAASLESGLSLVEPSQRVALQTVIDELRSLEPGIAGKAIRVHGDYHLGQTLRSFSGWYVFDFEGEPVRPIEERTQATSPLKDVAGMLRSFDYAAAAGLTEQISADREALRGRAGAWEDRNRDAFFDGYMTAAASSQLISLLPDPPVRDLILRGFELEKAIYELGYEKAYRPDWVAIPQAALERLLAVPH